MPTDQQNLLDNILATIRDEVATLGGLRATSAEVQSSDQDQYGFILVEVHVLDSEDAAQRLSIVRPAAFEELRDRTWDDLDLLDWDGVVGEDEGGYARLSIPAPTGAPTGI